VAFVECVVYHVRDARYPGGSVRVLAEPELEGRFTKWNNNAGAVRPAAPGGASAATAARVRDRALAALGALAEEEGDEGDEGDQGGGGEEASTGDVPQCFSHFTYEASDGEKLVCDLQVDPCLPHANSNKCIRAHARVCTCWNLHTPTPPRSTHARTHRHKHTNTADPAHASSLSKPRSLVQ
jgi:hypothetical protein